MSLTWRSPAMLPPPVDPSGVTPPAEPLARLVLGGAWRLRAFAHALAHGLRRVPGGAHHRAVARRIERALAGSDAFLAHPCLSAGDDPERLVQARLRLEPLPNCESWAEVAIADVLYGGALDRQVEALRNSADPDLAEAARQAAPADAFGLAVLRELSRDARNAPCLQILVDRWLASACRVFGRPGSPSGRQLEVEGIQPGAEQSLLAFLRDAESELWNDGLEATDGQFMGIVVPEGWAPRRHGRKPPQR